MPRKLRLDGLRADRAAVHVLLFEAEQIGDPVGKLQYEYRLKQIEAEIRDLEGTPEHCASVALFFGGNPVLGSRGILADFAGSALSQFQQIVTKRFASAELGSLGTRGPVPLSDNTHLMITEIARGSFGFVLDEFSDQQSMCNTALKMVVNEVTDVVYHTAAPDDAAFEEVAEKLDQRSLIALKDFFVTLDTSNATVRIVEEDRDFLLDSPAVHRGRLRTEATTIDEKNDDVIGELLGFLPEHRRYELRKQSGEVISGAATKQATEQYISALHSPQGASGKVWRTKMSIRTIQRRNRAPKVVYTLLEFIEQVQI